VNLFPRGLALLSTCGAIVLVLLVYSPALEEPFLAPKLAVLEVSATLGVVALALSRVISGGPRLSRAWLLAATFVVLTTLVSWLAARGRPEGVPYAVDALLRWGSLFGIACGAAVVAGDEARSRVLVTVAFTSALVAAVGLLQHVGLLPRALSIPVVSMPGSTFGNRNLAAEVMAMALPLSIGALVVVEESGDRVLVGVAVAIEIVFLAVTRARGAWFGAACGMLTVGWLLRHTLTRRARGWALPVAVAAIVAAVVPGRFTTHDMGDSKRYAPALTVIEGAVDPESTALKTRLGFWRRTLEMVRGAPALGVGPGNWPVVFPRFAEPGATRDGVLTMTLAPRQAHDDLVERAGETGVIGLVALLFLGLVTARSLARTLRFGRREGRGVGAAAAGSLAALLGLTLASFPLEMPATLTLAGVALGFSVAPDPSRLTRPRPSLLYLVAPLSFTLLVLASVRVERRVRGSYWLAVAENALRTDGGASGAEAALAALAQSREAGGASFPLELRTAQMLARLQRGDEAAGAAERALAIERYSVNATGALAYACVVGGRLPEARDAATRALALLHDYPLALYVRARALAAMGDPAAEADRTALRALAEESRDRDTQRAARALLSELQ
jgi:O-antigen ligase